MKGEVWRPDTLNQHHHQRAVKARMIMLRVSPPAHPITKEILQREFSFHLFAGDSFGSILCKEWGFDEAVSLSVPQ